MSAPDIEGRLRRKARKHGFVLVTMRGAAEPLVGPYALVPIGSGLKLNEVEWVLKQETKKRVH